MPVGQGKIGFLPWRVTGHISHTLGQGQHKTAQNRLMFYCVCIYSVWFGYFFFVLLIFFYFLRFFSFLKERGRDKGKEQIWVGREVGKRSELGEVKAYDENIFYKRNLNFFLKMKMSLVKGWGNTAVEAHCLACTRTWVKFQ